MKGQANLALGIIAVIAVVFIASQAGVFKGNVFSELIGGHVLALSQTYVETSDPTLGGKTWVAAVVVNGGGQKIVGDSYSTSELASITPGSTFKDPLSLTFQFDKLTGVYGLAQNNINKLYQFNPVPVSFTFILGGGLGGATCTYDVDGSRWFSPRGYYPENSGGVSGNGCGGTMVPSDSQLWTNAYKLKCNNEGGVSIYKSVSLPSDKPFTGDIYPAKVWKCYKPNPVPVYTAFQLNAPSFNWATTFKLSNSKGTDSITVSNANLSGKSVGGNFAASFSFAGVSLKQQFPSESSVTVVSGSTGSKIVSYISDFSSYGTQLPSSGSEFTESNWNAQINGRNDLINKALSTTKPDWNSAQVMSVQGIPASVVLDKSSQPPFYPTFQLLVKADWLGIGIPICKPEIVSSSCSLRSGSGGAITATLKNNGDTDAACILSAISQDSALTIGSQSQTVSIPTGAARTFSWGQVTASSKTDTQLKYSLTASDSLGSNKVSQDFYCSVSGFCTLTPVGNYVVDASKCELVCTLNQATCALNSQSFNSNTCECYSGPTPPPITKCIDDTPLGQCSQQSSGYLCTMDGKLVPNDSCKTIPPYVCPSGSISVLGSCVDLMQLGILLVLLVGVGFLIAKGGKK